MNKKFKGFSPITKNSSYFFKNILNKYDFHLIQKEIESYGYTYSFKTFVFTALLSILIMLLIAFYIKLKIQYILLLIISVLLIMPFIIKSQFRQMYELKRFEMVTNYLDNIIPIFKRTPLISLALKEVSDLLEDEMKEVVDKALMLLTTNTDDPDVIKSAFYIIEQAFPNTRIHSVHSMMYTIHTQNTKNYILSVDNMWIDVQAWIKRVTLFQKELKERKTKLLILSILTAASNCIFVSMYSSNDVFKNFTDHIIYQTSSTIFMIVLMIVICLFQIKLNGKWLLDDQTLKDNKKAMKSFQYISQPMSSIKTKDKVMSVICLLFSIFMFVKTRNIVIVSLFLYISYMFYSQNKRIYRKHLNQIKKHLQIEFPSWMRDVSLNLVNLTVINAIEKSKDTASMILSYYIDSFLKEIEVYPTSIKPYNHFLDDFHIDGVKSSMKVLYSLQSLDQEEMQAQTSYLIIRNQEMLDNSESIKNEDTLSGVKLLGFIPVMIFVIQMLISMGLLFSVMMNLMSQSLTF